MLTFWKHQPRPGLCKGDSEGKPVPSTRVSSCLLNTVIWTHSHCRKLGSYALEEIGEQNCHAVTQMWPLPTCRHGGNPTAGSRVFYLHLVHSSRTFNALMSFPKNYIDSSLWHNPDYVTLEFRVSVIFQESLKLEELWLKGESQESAPETWPLTFMLMLQHRCSTHPHPSTQAHTR